MGRRKWVASRKKAGKIKGNHPPLEGTEQCEKKREPSLHILACPGSSVGWLLNWHQWKGAQICKRSFEMGCHPSKFQWLCRCNTETWSVQPLSMATVTKAPCWSSAIARLPQAPSSCITCNLGTGRGGKRPPRTSRSVPISSLQCTVWEPLIYGDAWAQHLLIQRACSLNCKRAH